MKRYFPLFGSALATLLLSGCLASAAPRHAGGADPNGASRMGSVTIITADQLWERGGDVLSAVRYRVANMQVRPNDRCPSIVIRGQDRLAGRSDPRIYVDGQPAVDTCILELIRADDVQSVEVYPMGVTRRAGYPSHPFGLILVFLREAER